MHYVLAGWIVLSLSAACFFISTHAVTIESHWEYALWMITTRLLGFGGFIFGAVSLFHRYWINGSLLLFGSVTLPIISLFLYGKL